MNIATRIGVGVVAVVLALGFARVPDAAAQDRMGIDRPYPDVPAKSQSMSPDSGGQGAVKKRSGAKKKGAAIRKGTAGKKD